MDLKRRLGMMSCIWRHRQVIMILFTYLCIKICLLVNTPAPVGTTLRCRRNSRRFEAGVPEKKIPEQNYAWLIRNSEAGNIRKQLWLRIPKRIKLRLQPGKLVLLYLAIILLANSYAPEPNAGPRAPQYSCGSCQKAVTWNTPGVCCDSCDRWYHKSCIGMNTLVYQGLHNVSWNCDLCQGRSYPKMKCTQICLKVWQTLPHLAEVALRQGVWGKWCKILHSCNFLALKMIPRKPNFHEQQVNF